MNLDGLFGVRLIKVKAAITYLEYIKKTRILFLYFLLISSLLLLMCTGIILVGLSFLREFNGRVFLFGAGLIFITALAMWFLLSQRAWIKIFGIDKLIENIKKGVTK